jgi:hypothetical protein
MHLCTCVSEEGGDGEAACSETPSLCTCVSEEGGDGEAACSDQVSQSGNGLEDTLLIFFFSPFR